MKKAGVNLVGVAALAGALLVCGGARAAEEAGDLDHINVTYHGGPIIPHVKVSTLYWGIGWDKAPIRGYFNGFFKELFADGRYLANLAQYSTESQTIENGEMVATAIDSQQPPRRVTDTQIRNEIRAQIAAGHLPKPDENSLYFVFTAPGVVVDDEHGADSEHDFAGYHDYSGDGRFAYAVIPYQKYSNDARPMTLAASHELAEAVTDQQPTREGLAWYDDNNGEIGDIPVFLYAAGRIALKDLVDILQGTDGTKYIVQKEWSLKANAPFAFAEATIR